MTAPIRQRLASVAAALRAGARLDADVAALIANALDRIVDGEPADAALGLRRQRADLLAAIRARNRILRDAAATMLPGLPLVEAANCIHKAMLRYRESAWERERHLDQCPLRHRGKLRGAAWEALQQRDHVPSPRSIRRILANPHCPYASPRCPAI